MSVDKLVDTPVVHLCIPQLLQPLMLWKKDFLFEPEAPELGQLFRQFDVIQDKEIKGLEASLFDILGMEERQELPAAFYRYQMHKKSAPKRMRVCADPIHLEVGMNDITLTEKITDLSDLEADEIIESINLYIKRVQKIVDVVKKLEKNYNEINQKRDRDN